ncbi:hypothetical protein L211DRAFT_847196 [Terfezia boudieri ATCC MYA-4762]|uniref:BTB domain-containing protein n=1 Tax=Terfezia boudieri ATCC MYA-4762 TaxID=1051890 RepID=A0A3N4LXX7_9PEZI|nr:hypothetical protein L211DRAFT_847196 [Terfezia boudieri ATCC MYA-4762]
MNRNTLTKKRGRCKAAEAIEGVDTNPKPQKMQKVSRELARFQKRWGTTEQLQSTRGDLVPPGRLFTITVGVKGKRQAFTVELEAFGALSDVLYKHTHNKMREGLKASMTIEDVDPDTMKRLLAWGKVGYYPSCESMDISKFEIKKLKRMPLVLKQAYYGLRKSVPQKETEALVQRRKGYKETVLKHAQVYVLADRFNIDCLKTYALERIQRLNDAFINNSVFRTHRFVSSECIENLAKASFEDLTVPKDFLDNFIEVVRYSYNSLTPPVLHPLNRAQGELLDFVHGPVTSSRRSPRKATGRVEGLLQHLCEVAASHLCALRAEEAFVELLKDIPDFAAGVVMVPPMLQHCLSRKTGIRKPWGISIKRNKAC